MEAPVYNDQFAGFGRRLAAYLIDFAIICFIVVNVYYFFNSLLNAYFTAKPDLLEKLFGHPEDYAAYRISAEIAFRWTMIFNFFLSWCYYAGFEASPWQATPGKRLLGLYVTTEMGNRVSFTNASGRYFAKIISGFVLCFGYLAILFSSRKQAWHDNMAHCLVFTK